VTEHLDGSARSGFTANVGRQIGELAVTWSAGRHGENNVDADSTKSPTIKQLEVLSAVAKHGSEEKAAEALHVTKASISKHLIRLATNLALQPLVSSSGGLSEVGSTLAKAGLPGIVKQYETFSAAARDLARPPDRLAVGAFTYHFVGFLNEVEARLVNLHANATVESIVLDDDGSGNAIVEAFGKRRVDLAVTYRSSRKSDPLYRNHLVAVFPTSREDLDESVSLERLCRLSVDEHLPLLLTTGSFRSRRLVDEHWPNRHSRSEGREVTVREVNNVNVLVDLARKGRGVALVFYETMLNRDGVEIIEVTGSGNEPIQGEVNLYRTKSSDEDRQNLIDAYERLVRNEAESFENATVNALRRTGSND